MATWGCGDNGPAAVDAGGSPDGAWPELGEFDQPGDFPRDDCGAGSLDGLALEGVYHIQIDIDGYLAAGAIRFDDLGGGNLGGVIAGHDDATVHADPSDVILRYADEDTLRSMNFCARDSDGTLHGSYARCYEDECATDPVLARRIDRLPGPVADGITLLGELGPWPVGFFDAGITVNLRVVDDVAYLARYQDGLRIVDVSDPANPTEVGHLAVEYPEGREIYNDVKIIDGPGATRYALMASDLAGAVVVDVTTPSAPAIVAHFGSPADLGDPVNVHSIFVEGSLVYLANIDVGLEIYDLANPLGPVEVGSFRHPDDRGDSILHDLYVSGDRAYLDWWDLGMAIVDVSNPATPTMIGNFEDYGERSSHSNWVTQVGPRLISVHGDEQWGAHVHIVDVTEGSVDFGNAIGEWETRPEVSVHNIMASGDLALMAYYQDGIRVLDLSDPTTPVELAHYDTYPGYDRAYGYNFFEGAVGIDFDPATRNIYVADSHRGLLVLHLDR